MLRGTDVQLMMTRVATALARAPRDRDAGTDPIIVHAEGDGELGLARLRDEAEIKVDFLSGSDRAMVGRAVRFAKRVVRRGLRWYVGPMMEQQSRFNHSVLDLVETMRLRNELLTAELEARADSQSAENGTKPPARPGNERNQEPNDEPDEPDEPDERRYP